MSYEVQSSTSASDCCETINSFTPTLYPSANTSKPASRKANVSSSAISGVSSISSMRRKRALLLDGAGAGQPFLLAFARLQIHHPDPPARGVIRATIVFKHRAPGLQRAHCEGDSFEIVARVVQHFVRVPVVGENRIARMHAQHSVVAVVRRLRAHLARRAALLAFSND